MQEFHLRLLWWQRLVGPAVILACCLGVLVSPIVFPWRLSAAAVLLVAGTAGWWRHLARRPVRLFLGKRGELSCEQIGIGATRVSEVLLGTVHPRLLSAHLILEGGRGCDLWVPGSALDDDAHRELRAALLRLGERPARGRI